MNQFLAQSFYGNTLQAYLIVAGVIALAIFVKRILTKYSTAIVYRFFGERWKAGSKETFDEYILVPVERLFMVIVVFAAFGTLQFPPQWNITLWGHPLIQIISAIAAGILIVAVTSLLVRFLDYLVITMRRRNNNRSASENQLLFFFKDFIKVILIIFGIVFILKVSFGVDVGKLLTGLSIVGAALALAARESLENIIASFVIFFDKPFVTGDVVKIKEFVGTVEKIGLRSTRITTFTGTMVAVPNKQMVDNILDNWSKRDYVQNDIKALLPAKIPVELLLDSITRLEAEVTTIDGVQMANAFLQELTNDNSIVIITYSTPLTSTIDEANEVKQQINVKIKGVQEAIALRLQPPPAP